MERRDRVASWDSYRRQLTRALTAIDAAVEVALEDGDLLEATGFGSGDGRIGGTWIVEAQSAAKVLRRALEGLLEDEQIDSADATSCASSATLTKRSIFRPRDGSARPQLPNRARAAATRA